MCDTPETHSVCDTHMDSWELTKAKMISGMFLMLQACMARETLSGIISAPWIPADPSTGTDGSCPQTSSAEASPPPESAPRCTCSFGPIDPGAWCDDMDAHQDQPVVNSTEELLNWRESCRPCNRAAPRPRPHPQRLPCLRSPPTHQCRLAAMERHPPPGPPCRPYNLRRRRLAGSRPAGPAKTRKRRVGGLGKAPIGR